jgi:hypothetical protein
METMDVILDLETYSTRSDAVILSFAAIRFKRANMTTRGSSLPLKTEMETFYRRVTIGSCEALGLHTDPETVVWWSKQDKKVRDECINNTDRVSIEKALTDFKSWFGRSRYIWGNGSCFDVTIIETAMNRCGLTPPWKFWNIRDVRTLYDLGGVRSSELPQADLHNPIDDCYRELIGMDMAIKNLLG